LVPDNFDLSSNRFLCRVSSLLNLFSSGNRFFSSLLVLTGLLRLSPLSYQQQLFPEPFLYNWLFCRSFAFGASTLRQQAELRVELLALQQQQQLLQLRSFLLEQVQL
jgi:hypothetical protein